MTMYEKKSSAHLKQIARGLMLGKYRNAITVLLANDLLLSTLSLFTTTASTTLSGVVIGILINFIVILLGSILLVGQYSFYLNIACNQSFQFTDLFTGFKVYPDKIIITSLVSWLITSLPLVPALIVFIVAAFMPNIPILFLIGCLLLIVGTVLSCLFMLRFSQVHYLLLDFPEYSAMNLLKLSWKLMHGNCGRLFYLYISFLPLTLVGLFTFGIGLLFIHPYQQMTYTLFYLDLIQSQSSIGVDWKSPNKVLN